MPSHYIVRRATPDDLPALTEFFRKAYGPQSVFGHAPFLQWFLGGGQPGRPAELNAMVALNGGDIVAHYGMLVCGFTWEGRLWSGAWGVNAYTIEPHRGKGLSGELLALLLRETDCFGVIGFTSKTADYYEHLGFNLFARERARRYVLGLQDGVFDIAARIGVPAARARALLTRTMPAQPRPASPITPIRSSDAERLALGEMFPGLTSERTPAFLHWRFLQNPFVRYELFGARENGRICAYVALRRTLLQPTQFHATSLVDLAGPDAAVAQLLEFAAGWARARGDLYVEALCHGVRYEAPFRAAGFACLQGDDADVLPLVTSPVERRPNHEYLGLFSATHAAALQRLTCRDVFFTRADSDRDRAARLCDLASSGESAS